MRLSALLRGLPASHAPEQSKAKKVLCGGSLQSRAKDRKSFSQPSGRAGRLSATTPNKGARTCTAGKICRKKETAAEVLQCRKTKMPSIARPSNFGMRCGRLARSLCKTELRSLLDKQSQNPFSFPAEAPGKIAPTSWICWLERVSRAEACMTGAGNIQRIVAFVALELM